MQEPSGIADVVAYCKVALASFFREDAKAGRSRN
jgi:hypothetical protein